MTPLKQCVTDIAAAVFCSCGADGFEREIEEALSADTTDGTPLPNRSDIAKLVDGDDDGVVPYELKELYPNLDFILDRKCT